MIYNLYCIRNTLSGSSDGLFMYLTDGQASVELASKIKHDFLLKENELFCVGTFNCMTREVDGLDSPRFVAWDTRRLESKMEPISDEQR